MNFEQALEVAMGNAHQLKQLNPIDRVKRSMENSLILILWWENKGIVFINWGKKWEFECTTSRFWFWNAIESLQTPIWFHKISECIGEGENPYMQFRARKPTGKILEVNHWPAVVWRILTLQWLEIPNRNTLARDIYIHWSCNRQFWNTSNLRQSNGCIWLIPEEMIHLFDTVSTLNSETIVFISPTS